MPFVIYVSYKRLRIVQSNTNKRIFFLKVQANVEGFFFLHMKTVHISTFLVDKNVLKILNYLFAPRDIQGMSMKVL